MSQPSRHHLTPHSSKSRSKSLSPAPSVASGNSFEFSTNPRRPSPSPRPNQGRKGSEASQYSIESESSSTSSFRKQSASCTEQSRSVSPNLLVPGSAGMTKNQSRSQSFTRQFSSERVSFGRHGTSIGSGGSDSRKSSSSVVDPKQVLLYMRRRESSASGPFTVVSHGSSRPVSADSVNFAPGESMVHTLMQRDTTSPTSTNPTSEGDDKFKRTSSVIKNHVIVIPNERGRRGAPPPLVRSISAHQITRRPRSHYLNEIVFEIQDKLYMGGIESAYNQNLLCRLGIEYIVDASNVSPDRLPKSKRSNCPCLCPQETPHSRARMTLSIDENSTADQIGCFAEVNQFIDRAHSMDKSVLIHSYFGRNRCAVFTVQFLMKTRKMPLEKAVELIKQICPLIKISDNFFKSLRRWENLNRDATNGAAAGSYPSLQTAEQNQIPSVRTKIFERRIQAWN